MGFITQLVARVITGTALPEEAENNVNLAAQIRNTPDLIESFILQSGGMGNAYKGKLHFVSSDSQEVSRPTVLFVHGSPGSWESFAPYFLQEELLEQFRVVALDRPGWGRSTLEENFFPSQLSVQANLLGPVIKTLYEQNQQQKIVLVGHSLGGSLVPILASRYPEFVRSILILAGDVNPVLAKHRWYNSLLACVPRYCVKKHWYHSNLEILGLSKSLLKEQEAMVNLSVPIHIMQGTHDKLTDPRNADFADSLFKKSDLTVQKLPNKGHMINLLCVDLVHESIIQAYESIDNIAS
ncbi:alpha/beta fold hydrolase [Marinomonas pollencensis]|uniref:Alpha/beta hydrolase family protein n=1 Tax=Marinomonas pollencensis TaxID=491954 RepID=A0A3E0DD19_9GAMM|nr:alpha/beta fold hydrolase [Marinomonas pollencensis]REG79428.1 alpha/beta hydrolase family protein [Marinomonas pollencensis]